MRSIVLICLISLTTVMLRGQDQFSLEDAVSYAFENSYSIKDHNYELLRAEQQINETRSIGLPKVNGSVDLQHFLQIPTSLIPSEFFGGNSGEFTEVQFGTKNNLTAGIEANWLAFDATYFLGLRAAKEYRELTRLDIGSREKELKKSVTQTYLSALILSENIKTLDSNMYNLNQVLYETQKIYESGFIEKIDVDRLDLSIRNLEADKESLENSYNNILSVLKYQIGYPLDQEIQLKDDMISLADRAVVLNIDSVLDLTQNPTIQLLEQQMVIKGMEVERYQYGYYPNLVLYGQYSQSMQSDKLIKKGNDWFATSVIGAKINVPIFDGFEKKSKIQKAEIELLQMQDLKENVAKGIQLEVMTAKIQYNSAKEKYFKRKANLELTQDIYQITKIKYKEGVGSSLELTTAERDVCSSQANLNQSIYDLLVAKYNYETALGIN